MAIESIGSRIQAMREERGMNASTFAKACGVTSTAVWNWEKNGINPRPDMLTKIAKTLGVSKEFLQGSEPIESSEEKSPSAIIEILRESLSETTGFPLDQIQILISIGEKQT